MNNKKAPIISIIIATYNSEKTLQVALDSIFNQSFQNWECIVVDGASNDGTIDIVKEYASKDFRFRYISEPDRGVYDAFNKGWKMAKGEWIHYLGDDDRLTVNGLADLMAEPHDDVEVISGNCYIEKIDGKIKPNISHGFFGCHQGKLVRRSTLERFRGFDLQYPILADKDLMVRMENAGVRIVNIDTFVAYFSMNGMSQDIHGLIKRAKERYRLMKANNLSNALSESVSYVVKDFFAISYRQINSMLLK